MMDASRNNETNTRKRARVESESDSASGPVKREAKRVEIESVSDSDASRVESESDSGFGPVERESKRVENDSVNDSDASRVDSDNMESGLIRNEILDILDDTDTVPEIQDLDSVIRSFEEEIFQPVPASFTDESQPDLGYLLEASDDELGLPPATSPTPKHEFPPVYDSFESENGLTSRDTFGFGENYEVMNEFLAVGGLFDYPDASDFSEFLWRPETETLPAV